jgi:hypothetical protein
VSAAGTQFSLSFNIGDWIISNGSAWEKVDNTDAVSSVFGRMGAVVGVSTDYSSVGITATAVGASSPSTGAFTTLSSTSTTTLNSTTIPASKTLVVTTDKISVLAATTSAELAGVISDETGSGALVFATSPTLVTPALGAATATSLTVNDNTTLGSSNTDTVNFNARVASDMDPATDNTYDLGRTGHEWRDLNIDGTANIDSLVADTADINGGTIDATAIGATTPSSVAATTGTFSSTLGVTGVATLGNGAILGTPASGTVTNLTGTASININGTVGATTPSTVAATTVLATSNGDVLSIKYLSNAGSALLAWKNEAGTTLWDIGGGIVASQDELAIRRQGSAVALFTSAGAAITGTLSTTGTATIGGAVTIGGTAQLTGSAPKLEIYHGTAVKANISGTDVLSVSSTGAAITGTLSSTGQISGSSTGAVQVFSGTSTAAKYIDFQNGTNSFLLGRDNSTGVTLGTGFAYESAIIAPSGGGITLGVNFAPIARITSTGLAVTGTLSCTTGAAVGGATAGAGGLAFPATAVAVADANTLDDYEEGTWTPTLFYQNTSGVTRTYTSQDGRYTKIGNTVTVWCYIAGATSNSGSYANDNIGIDGIPFTANATAPAIGPIIQSGFSGSTTVGTVFVRCSGTTALILSSTNGGNLADDFGAGATYQLYFTATYRV